VIGTSDLSELALGWCTYGVVTRCPTTPVNASVPKTLMAYVIRWVAESEALAIRPVSTAGILATK